MADDNSATCLSCRRCTSTEVNYIAPPAANQSSSDEGGFVRGVVTYMVMDDLVVKPMSTISSITLLNKFNVKEVGALEKVVDFTMAEVCNSANLSVILFLFLFIYLDNCNIL